MLLCFLRPIPAPPLLAVLDALAIQDSACDVIADTGKVFNSASVNGDDGMFLKIVAFAHYIRVHLVAVCKAHAGDFSQGGIRLFGSHSGDFDAYSAFLRAALFELHGAVLQGIKGKEHRWSLGFTLWASPLLSY